MQEVWWLLTSSSTTQKKYGGKVDWWKLQRKEMIVDMEKKQNILKWLRYAYQTSKVNLQFSN